MRRSAAHTKADRKLLEAMQRNLERGESITSRKASTHRVRHQKPTQPKSPAPVVPRPPSAEDRAAYLKAKEWARFGGVPSTQAT